MKAITRGYVDYVIGLIKNNSAEKLFPITHKNSHGCQLACWSVACNELNIRTEFRWYKHHVADAEGCFDYEAIELMLI